jgi:RNase H-like domain found in reverse transcriptase
VREVEFLGHLVSSSGVRPLSSHVEAIREFPRPSTVKELQKFLGLLNFYRRFVPCAAQLLRLLTDALAGKRRGLTWSDEMQRAFEQAKLAVAEVAELTHPDPAAPISLTTDASATHMGAVLQQWHVGSWRLLAFFSRKLSKAEVNYSTTGSFWQRF